MLHAINDWQQVDESNADTRDSLSFVQTDDEQPLLQAHSSQTFHTKSKSTTSSDSNNSHSSGAESIGHTSDRSKHASLAHGFRSLSFSRLTKGKSAHAKNYSSDTRAIQGNGFIPMDEHSSAQNLRQPLLRDSESYV